MTWLANLVRKGRKEFLAQFPRIKDPQLQDQLADPGAPDTFERCKLDWTGWGDPWYNATPRQQALLDVLQDLLDGGLTDVPTIALKAALRLEIPEADILRSRKNVDAAGDSGYFQRILWPRLGYRQATMAAVLSITLKGGVTPSRRWRPVSAMPWSITALIRSRRSTYLRALFALRTT